MKQFWKSFNDGLAVCIALTLLWKAHLLNNLNDTLAQDRLDIWIALGVAFLLIRSVKKN